MEKIEVKFGEWIENGFNLYKENFGILVLASLIAGILSVVTLGILAGPMMAGFLLITLRLFDKQEPKPEVGDVFKGFEYFLNSFLFILVWAVVLIVVSFLLGLVPCVGPFASVFVVYVIQSFLMFGLFLIVDEQMEFWPASMESFERVKTNFWPFLGLFAVSSIIASIGAIACGIGVFLTVPIQACILTVAYRDIFSGVSTPAVTEETPPQETDNGGETPSQG